jgi:hypothetical protein
MILKQNHINVCCLISREIYGENKLRLPIQKTYIEEKKILDYSLSENHASGQCKAKFFFEFGFYIEQWQIFLYALRVHGASHEIVDTIETEYGTKYIVDGSLKTPDGRNPYVRTVWQIDKGNDYPRFITAYPAD